eukprot:195080-Pyramimonas_sp.AAC.1
MCFRGAEAEGLQVPAQGSACQEPFVDGFHWGPERPGGQAGARDQTPARVGDGRAQPRVPRGDAA